MLPNPPDFLCVIARFDVPGIIQGAMVPRRGLEPPRPCERQHLKLVRLPIPPPGHGMNVRVGGALKGDARALSTPARRG